MWSSIVSDIWADIVMCAPSRNTESVNRMMVHHSGIVSGFNKFQVGDKELIDKFPDEYTDGILAGMGMTARDYKKYLGIYKHKFRKEILKDADKSDILEWIRDMIFIIKCNTIWRA